MLRAFLSALMLSLAAGAAGVPAFANAPAGAQVELVVTAGPQPLRPGRLGEARDRAGRPLDVERLDLLLSGFSLQRRDGSWTKAEDWYGFFRAGLPVRRERLPAVPAGEYVAARFAVGVPPAANHGDPNRLAPHHPLHPLVNGLHWGWRGGYVFMALEGHWQFDGAPAGTTGGYSYHLAGDENLITMTLPARLRVDAGTVLRLKLDARRLLAAIDVSRDGDSTHSRTRDKALHALLGALPVAFSIEATDGGVAAQAAATGAGAVRNGARAGGRAYPLTIDASLPQAALPADNPLTVEGVELGRLLFNDPRLSRDGKVSCASCHRADAAFSDPGRAVSVGIDGRRGTRNAMPLFNLAWVNEFFWDGRSDALRRQALEPIAHPDEMAESVPRVVAKLSADREMTARFRRALGGAPSGERIGLAIEQYLLSIVSQDSKFDRAAKGVAPLTAQEKRGQELFLTEHDPARGLRGADCFHCHGGSLFTHNRFANNGLALSPGDVGREAVSKDPADRGKFRTPSLRNVAVTGPYMHDGRFRTLEEVVEHYDRGVVHGPTLDPNLAKHPKEGLRLSAEDKAALVAFLKTLTDPALAGGGPQQARGATAGGGAGGTNPAAPREARAGPR